MLYRITRKFDAAHWLLNYDGPCKNLHGHTWKIQFEIRFSHLKKLDDSGIGVDFKLLKTELDKILPDHDCLNQVFCRTMESEVSPSAENLATWIFKKAQKMLAIKFGLDLFMVELWESDDCSVTATKTDMILRNLKEGGE